MRYYLSKLIPVPMRSEWNETSGRAHRSTWVQWRDRVFFHRDALAAA